MKKYNFSEMIMPNYRNDKYFLVEGVHGKNKTSVTNAVSYPNIFCDWIFSAGVLVEVVLYFAY